MNPRILLTAAVVLAGCSKGDPAEIALAERAAVASVVAVGAPFAPLGSTLAAKGYDCRMSRGDFTAESGAASSARTFMRCDAQTKPFRDCAIRTRLIVVPKAGVVEQVHFFAGSACLRSRP